MPNRIGGHVVLGELGHGGMARVYRVFEEAKGREVALKQLLKCEDEARNRHAAALFEREFHTLVQLSHPRVIEVYDYGVAESGPYYTMELLDGGDLRKRSPLPWREACELIHDVCSSLALLHSRRLVHRDITPRNVHCTKNGHAKLIDFGAMAPMGPGGHVVGTPAFVAPEVVHRSALDGRTDLYSLGATLYYALTGRMPYPARDLASVLKAWLTPATPPSLLVPDVPPALDALVMSLISLEPAMRPRGAFEVMQRLAAIAGIERAEPVSVSQAYLSTPLMVGRDEPLLSFRGTLQRALRGRGGGLLVQAQAGLGRSRLLDAFAIEAKLLGAITLRAGAHGGSAQPLAAARSIAEQLAEALPDAALEAAHDLHLVGTLFDAEPAKDAAAIAIAPRTAPIRLRAIESTESAQIEAQSKLASWVLRVARRHTLLIAVDDADHVDEPSIAVLAAVAQRARRARILLALTSATTTAGALDVLASHCTTLALRPLEPAEIEALLSSVFGDVPHIPLLAHRIHSVADGRPRECLVLAQGLVDRGVIQYAGGTWTLPSELSATELPARASDVFRARIAQLGVGARRAAQAQALAIEDGFTRDDHAQLDPGASSEQLEDTISELLRAQVLQGDGAMYRLSNDAVKQALLDTLEPDERRRLHLRLAELCQRMGRPAIHEAMHLLEAGESQRAIDRLLAMLGAVLDAGDLGQQTRMSYAVTAALMERALDAAEALGRSRRDVSELRRWLFTLAIAVDDRLHHRAGPALLAQLARDSGLEQYRLIDDAPDPMQRLMRALTRTQELSAQLPEDERVYSIQDAIKHLVYYVVISIAIGARTFDKSLLASLPGLLEPFVPLSPAVDAMWHNAVATLELHQRKFEAAHARWSTLYAKLEKITPAELQRVDVIRNAIAYAIGAVEAQLGIESAGRWAELLDRDPLQQVNAMYLRRAVCMQLGDFENAERFRRKAEVLAVHATTRPMVNTHATLELGIHAQARDLTGVKEIMDRIEHMAATASHGRAYHHLATGHFHRLRGDLVGACSEYERALALSTPDAGAPERSILAWPPAAAAYIEVLVERGDAEAARAFGERTLAQCGALGIEVGAFEIVRALALAEGKCGRLVHAGDRLELLIAAQRKLGVVGLNLGASYEARARIAIWAADHASVEHYGRLAAIEYRHGRASPLGLRYERLREEALTAGIQALPQLTSIHASPPGTALGGRHPTIETSVIEALSDAETPQERAQLALGLLCEVHSARGGHLYLLRDGKLGHAATLGVDAPEDELLAILEELWRQQLSAADMPTTLAPNGALPAPSSMSLISDTHGTEFQPITVQCVIDGAQKLAGFAALVPGHIPQPRSDAQHVVSVVGSYLVRVGDAHAVST